MINLCRHKNTVFEIHEKVSFKIASEASYVYILSGQKVIKNGKKCHQTVLIGQKLLEMPKFK